MNMTLGFTKIKQGHIGFREPHMLGVLLRRERDCETHSEDLAVMEAEVGMVQVQVKNSRGYHLLPEAVRDKESFL